MTWVPKNADEALNPNSGVFLVKNCPAAFAFLEEWNGLSEALPHHKFKWPVDEAALRERFFRGDGSNQGVRVLAGDDYKLLNGNDGIFIRHPMGGSWNPQQRAEQKTVFIEQYRPKVVFSPPHSDSSTEHALKTRSASGTQLERRQVVTSETISGPISRSRVPLVVHTMFNLPFACGRHDVSDPAWIATRIDLYLRFTVRSLERQIDRDLRPWLDCREGSQDELAPICRVLAAAGVSATFDRGRQLLAEIFDRSDAVYVTRLDSDDMYGPDAVQIILRPARRGPRIAVPRRIPVRGRQRARLPRGAEIASLLHPAFRPWRGRLGRRHRGDDPPARRPARP